MEQPEPDTKNWTWVLDKPCEACGYDAKTLDRSDLGAAVRNNAAAWRHVLSSYGEALLAQRPPVPEGASPVWSALEYGAHVRDVYDIFNERMLKMVKKKSPKFKDWDPNKTALKEKYHQQDPAKVAYALAVNAGKFADLLDRLSDEEWTRDGLRSDGSYFTVESLAFYALHDPVHHLDDVQNGFDAISASS